MKFLREKEYLKGTYIYKGARYVFLRMHAVKNNQQTVTVIKLML